MSRPVNTAEQKKKFEALKKLQQKNGSFKLEPPLAVCIGVNYHTVKQEAQERGFDLDAWSTSLAVSYMDYGLSLLKDDEEMVKKNDKAVHWLEKHWIVSKPSMQMYSDVYFTNA